MNLRRIAAVARKEGLQVLRDPSSLLIAFVLPVLLLFLFAYAVSLDIRHVAVGLVVESDGPDAASLAAAFSGSRYFRVTPARDRRELAEALLAGHVRGLVVIPQGFDAAVRETPPNLPVQVITDGAQPNTANFVAAYAQGVIRHWAAGRLGAPRVGATLAPRFWFNAELESRRALVPGAIAIVMTMIGTLLTALVVAREWERGTMEALLSTPASVAEILVGKLLPYFGLGMGAMLAATLLATQLFGVPLRGSVGALALLSTAFLFPALGQGLVISILSRNQFVASQIALFSGFLPAFLLSGFIFEVDSMPAPLRLISTVVAARHFVPALQTVFLAGDVWPLFARQIAAMLAIGAVLFAVSLRRSRKSLEA